MYSDAVREGRLIPKPIIQSSVPEQYDDLSSRLLGLFRTKTTTLFTTVTYTNSIFAYCLSTTFWQTCPQ